MSVPPTHDQSHDPHQAKVSERSTVGSTSLWSNVVLSRLGWSKLDWSRFDGWHELVLLALLAGGLLLAAEWKPPFVHWRTQLLLSRHLWEVAILAIALTPIIIAGGIDLSVGSMMGLCAVAFGISHRMTGDVATAVAASLAVGCLAGATNGWLVARWHMHPLIVTLATYGAFRGIAEGASQGTSYSRFGDTFMALGRGRWVGIPYAAFLFATLLIVASLWLGRTTAGRYLPAIGYSERAARFSGIPVDRIRFALHTLAGLATGLATLIYVARFDTAKADAGLGFELDAITAVVIGGTAIQGGRGNLLGTTLGLLLIHEIRQFAGSYWQVEEIKPILVGSLLIAAILVRRIAGRWLPDPGRHRQVAPERSAATSPGP